jgi:hypothetical protein
MGKIRGYISGKFICRNPITILNGGIKYAVDYIVQGGDLD